MTSKTPRGAEIMNRFLLVMLFSLLCSNLGLKACPGQETRVQLPTNPANWLNSGPIPVEMLKGKAAIFYFFEES
jgi:hypothetical protein